MQVAVDQRLGVGQELVVCAPAPRPSTAPSVSKARCGGVELRAGPAVERRLAPGIGEDQVLGDPAELDIAREQREPALLARPRAGETEV